MHEGDGKHLDTGPMGTGSVSLSGDWFAGRPAFRLEETFNDSESYYAYERDDLLLLGGSGLGVDIRFEPPLVELSEALTRNGGSRTSTARIIARGQDLGEAVLQVTVRKSGAVKVSAGTYQNCLESSVNLTVTVTGQGKAVQLQAYTLAPGVGEIKIGVYDSSFRLLGWQELTAGTVGGMTVQELAGHSSSLPAAAVITQQPISQTVDVGQDVTFSAIATGSPPPTFQWQKDGLDVLGATSRTLLLRSVQSSDSANYTVRVSNPCGTIGSTAARLTVRWPPKIVETPASLTRAEGETAGFTASAAGAQPLSYQWLKEGVALVAGGRISSVTSTNLIIENVQLTDTGGYALRVTNLFGAATSQTATLTVMIVPKPPWIIRQPQPQSVAHGGRAVFEVECGGTGPLQYQWQKDGADLPGETNPTLVLEPVLPRDAGCYRVRVSNAVGSALSDTACLEILRVVGFRLAGREDGVPVFPFDSEPGRLYRIEFSEDLRVWRTLSELTADTDVSVLRDRDALTRPHRFYRLWAGSEPVAVHILEQPTGGSVMEGGEFTFRVIAEGSPPLSYLWYSDGEPLAGETNATLVLRAVSVAQAGAYHVVVRNPLGAVASISAELEVRPAVEPPRITRQPKGGVALVGNRFSFSVEAEGTPPLRYQWQREGVNITGATASLYVISNVSRASAGTYRVVVSNDVGSTTSVDVTLEIESGG